MLLMACRALGEGSWWAGKAGSQEIEGVSRKDAGSQRIPSPCILSLHLPEVHGLFHRPGHTCFWHQRLQTDLPVPSSGPISINTTPHCIVSIGFFGCSCIDREPLESKGLVLMPWHPQPLLHMHQPTSYRLANWMNENGRLLHLLDPTSGRWLPIRMPQGLPTSVCPTLLISSPPFPRL